MAARLLALLLAVLEPVLARVQVLAVAMRAQALEPALASVKVLLNQPLLKLEAPVKLLSLALLLPAQTETIGLSRTKTVKSSMFRLVEPPLPSAQQDLLARLDLHPVALKPAVMEHPSLSPQSLLE